MLKGGRKYIFFLSACFVILIVLQLLAPKPIDWNVSYLKKDKIPYGTSAFYKIFSSLFEDKQITVRNTPLYNVLKGATFKKVNYIFINDDFIADVLDIRELQNFVRGGNTAFISANSFDKKLMDTLKFATAITWNVPAFQKRDTADKNKAAVFRLNFYNPNLRSANEYPLEISLGSHFSKFDTASAVALGSINDKINFLKIPFGDGYFYLHSTPEIFANYNILKNSNIDYAEKFFSFLPFQQVNWDEYYKAGRVITNSSPLRVILNNPSLAAAYYLLVASILLFILIGIKRKQRIIPIIEPFTNTTLEFVNTIGTLYYQKGSHKGIAEKQIAYFISFLKSAFRLTATEQDEGFVRKLSALSGIEQSKVKALFDYISYIKAKSQLHEQELLQLNRMIEDFHKLNKR